MELPAGTRLGHYEITGTLGVGGMGEVYRARDPRLGREVAVKVLPERVSGSPEALSRFEREAKAVAGLSHPNILAIHDIGVESGKAFSVTELLEGETLRQRLAGSPLPQRKVLDYGVQIAHGLAAAHEKGVIHRDLKPENIFITHDGRAKILDFGLAKVDLSQEADLTASPTVDAGTRPGTVMGTMGYMSPEQVRGQPVDACSDIFSFGSVLYEMATGRKAFAHDTPADTMSAILKEDPPGLSGSSLDIPPALQRIVEHCLEKNPAERFQSARDLAFHLDAVGTMSSSSAMDAVPLDAAPARPGLRGGAVFLAGLVLGAALGAVAASLMATPGKVEPPMIRSLSYSGRDSGPSTSADGRLVAYTSVHEGRSEIWLKQLPGGDEVALTEGPDDREPRISPDGAQVVFTRFAGGSSALYRIPVLGGDPRKIVDDASDADWSPDGSSLAFVRRVVGAEGLSFLLMSVESSGQGEREITRVDLSSLWSPRWSPDGRTIAVVQAGTENAPMTIGLVPATGGEIRTVTPPAPPGILSSLAWTGNGEALLYAQAASIAASGTDEGTSRLILQEADSGRAEILMWLPETITGLDVLGDGRAVLGVSSARANLMQVSLTGAGSHRQAHRLTRGNSTDRQPVFSPDGKWLLFSSDRGGNLDLWRMDLATGAIRRVTEDRADDWDPAFTPDNRHILWSSNRTGVFEIWICAVDGTGARQLTQDGFDAENPTVTRDGEWVVYNSANPDHPGIWKIRMDGTDATRLVPGSWSTPDVSPDGLYVAYRMGSEPRTVYVARVEDGEVLEPPNRMVSHINNGRPRWMPDGRQLLFSGSDETGARGIFIQEFVPGEDTTATRRPLMEFVLDEPPESFGISPDGTTMIYSAADTIESLMLAEGLTGVTRPARGR